MQTAFLYIALLSLLPVQKEAAVELAAKAPQADLTVVSIGEPEWNLETRSTTVRVKVRNRGKLPSDTTLLRLSDPEVEGYSDALTAKATVVQFGEKAKLEKTFEQEVLPLAPKEEREYTFVFKYWVYDPDCELEAQLDPEKKHPDANAENDRLTLYQRAK